MTDTKHKPYPERMQWRTPVETSDVLVIDLRTILAALDKAQEAEHTASWKEQMAVEERDVLRAENEELKRRLSR